MGKYYINQYIKKINSSSNANSQISIDDLENTTQEERAEIRKHIQNGTIWNTIIADGDGSFSRVIAVVPPIEKIIIYSGGDGEIIRVDYNE